MSPIKKQLVVLEVHYESIKQTEDLWYWNWKYIVKNWAKHRGPRIKQLKVVLGEDLESGEVVDVQSTD